MIKFQLMRTFVLKVPFFFSTGTKSFFESLHQLLFEYMRAPYVFQVSYFNYIFVKIIIKKTTQDDLGCHPIG